MEIVLIRHGEPEWVHQGLSVDNPSLTELGHEQARRMAELLGEEPFDEVLVSPLVRARETAAPLLARLNRPGTVAPWLEEIRNPVWHGTPAEKAEEAFRAERARPSEQRWLGLDGGEPPRDFIARIHRGASQFLAQRNVQRVGGDLPVWQIDSPGSRIALVAHAGTNSVLICHLLGLVTVPWEWERFVIGHASVSRVRALEIGDGFTFSLTQLSLSSIYQPRHGRSRFSNAGHHRGWHVPRIAGPDSTSGALTVAGCGDPTPVEPRPVEASGRDR